MKDVEEELSTKVLQLEECLNDKMKTQLMVDEGNDEKEIIMNELRKCRVDMKTLEEQMSDRERGIAEGKQNLSAMEEKVMRRFIKSLLKDGLR